MICSIEVTSADYIVLGGGVAGLTMGREIARKGRSVIVVERGATVGGLARTFRSDGYSFDLGGHRFHSNNPGVVGWLKTLMGGDLLRVDRRSRIRLRGRFIDYPLRLTQATRAFGAGNAVRGGLSYLSAAATRHRQPAVTFEDWVTRRFGRALYEIYFKPYTEKVWGIRCDQLSADWAAQRISVPSLADTVRGALFPPKKPAPTAIRQFYYPRLGYGTISDRLADAITASRQQVWTSTSLASLRFGGADVEVEVRDAAGMARVVRCGGVISTVPLDALLAAMAHEPGIAEIAADARLGYRGLVLVYLGLAMPQVSPDSWTYFPSPDLLFGRTHEPKNWSAAMVPGPAVTSLALEIFSSPGEPAWESPDADLVDRAVGELVELGWMRRGDVTHSWVLRAPNAYPVQDIGYRARLGSVRAALDRFPQLRLVGRTGAFSYMNVDGVVEDCFRLADELNPAGQSGVRPLETDTARWA
jgi:protoporphyrinogen oxidase